MNSTSSTADAATFRPPRYLHEILLAFLFCWVAWQVLVPIFSEPIFGISWDKGKLTMRDFPAHLLFTRAVWQGHDWAREPGVQRSVYDVESHIEVVQQWSGQPFRHALPFGYSPTMIWFLGPFTILPPLWAYVAWTLLGFGAIGWMTRPIRSPPFFGPLFFLGPLTVWSFALGQTAILSTAAMLFLALRCPTSAANFCWRKVWPDVLILWLLTAKPPLAVTAAAALLACRRWQPVVLAAGLTAVSTLALTPWLGPRWVQDYVTLLANYDSQRADPAFAWCLEPVYMSNLRAFLYIYPPHLFGWLPGFSHRVPDRIAVGIGSVLWAISLAVLVGLGVRRRLVPGQIWGFAVLAFLLFSPHVNSVEDLHLYLLLALWAGPTAQAAGQEYTLRILVPLVIWLSPGAGTETMSIWRWPLLSFLGKCLLASLGVKSRLLSKREQTISRRLPGGPVVTC